MRHVSAYLLLFLTSAALSFASCADPNPTFVFDAATVAREGGTGGSGAVDAGAARDGADGRTDGSVEAQ